MKKLKILLIGERYSTNLGDGVIYDTVREMLIKEYKADVVCLDISGHNSYNLN